MLSRPHLRTTLLRTGCALAVGLLALLGASAALAQSTYWNGAGTTSLVGGSGTWDAGNSNWTTNPYSSHPPWSGGTNTAIFGNTAGTVTLANGYSASIGGLTFNQTGYTLGATGTGSLALSNSTTTFTTGANVNATISAPITGGSGNALVINGGSGSTLTLTSTANYYSGGTIINSGSVVVNNAAPCSAGFIFLGTGPVTLNAGASLLNGGNECAFKFMGPMTISGAVTVPTNSVTPFPVMTLSGGTIGSVNSTPTGDGAKYGTVAIDNAVAVTANSSINAFGAIWSQGGGAQLTVNSGVTLTIGGTFVHTLNADNGFNLRGGGTMVFTNDGNSYWGPTTVSVGTLVLGNGGTTGNLTDTTTGVSLGNAGTLKFNRSNNFTFSKSISGTGNVWQAGSGTTTLNAAHTYTGATTVDAGRLQLAYAAGNTLAGNGAITVNSGGTLGLGGLSQALTTGGNLTVNAGGTLDMGTNGTLLLGNGSTASIASVTGSGTITVNSGATLTLTGAIGNSNVNIVLAGGTLNLGNFAHSLGTLTQTVASTVNFTPASSLRVANMGTPFAGALSANGWIAGNSHFYATAINGNPAATGATGATGVVPLNQIALGSNTASTTYWVNTGEILSTNLSYNFWNGNAANTSLVGGSGTWNAASTNWTSNPYTSNNPWAGGTNIAIFGGTAGTVTVDTNYSASIGGVFFNVGGYTIVPSTGTSTLALAAATNTITTGAGLNATISAPITGGAGNALASAGGGTLTLAAASTYTGATNVTAGTLALGIANAIPAVSAVTVAPGATLNLAGLGQTLSAGLTSNGTLALGSGSTLTLSGGTTTIAAITGSGTVKVSTGATLTLTAALTNSNVNIMLDGGTLNLGNFVHSLGTLEQSKSSTLNFTSGSNLTVANIGSTFTGTLSATGWVMGGSHFYATAISGNPAKGTTGVPPLNQIALGTNAASATSWSNSSANPNEILVNNATFNLWNAAQDLGATYGGTGTWNGANSNWATYPGGANGTWVGAANTAIFGGTAGTVTLADGYNASIGGLIFNVSGTSVVPAASGTGTLALAAANNTITTGAGVNAKVSTIITGGSGNALVIAGGGTLTLSNAANSYAGGTTVQSGTLIVAGNVACSGSTKFLGTGALTINAGATVSSTGTSQCWFRFVDKINVNPNGVLTLQIDTVSGLAPIILNGGTIVTAGTVPIGTAATYGTAAFDNSVTVTADSTINAWGAILSQPGGPQFTVNSGVTLTMAGTIVKSANGDYGFTLLGGGTMVFTNDGNNYWSQTTVSVGTLVLGNGGTSGNLTDTHTGISLGSLGNLQFNRSNAFTFAKAISGAGNVAQVGSGTTTLTGTNTYTGSTSINAGTLALGVANALPAASAVTVASGATLNLAGFSQSLSAGLTSNGTLALGAGTANLTLSGGNSTLAAITGSGTITVNSGATLTLTGAISNSNVNIVLAGGTLNLGNFTHTLGTLTQTTAASTLNFTSVSNLTVGNIAGIANGLAATGWLAGSSHFYAIAISGNPAKNTTGVAPLNLIALGTNIPSATKWSSSNSEILAASSAFTLWSANGDGTSYGGNGTWNASDTNWATYPAQSGSTATWAGGSNIAIFDGTAGTVKLADGYNASVGGLTFNVDGYTLAPTTPAASGSLLMPAATNTLTGGQGVSATIGVPMTGAGIALNIAVGGTLTLSAQANPTTISTYTGGTTVQSGTLVLNNGTQTCANRKSLLGYGPLTIHAGASVVGAGMDNALGCNASYPGGGVSQVTVNTNGTLTLPSDYITILPAITLNGGTVATANNPVGGNASQWGTANFRSAVAVTANSTIKTIGACNNQIQAGGTQYTVGAGVTLTMAGTFVDTDPANNNSGFTLLGGGTMVFTNDGNSYTPTTTVSAGTLVLGNGGTSGNLTATSGVSLGSSGTLQFNRSNAFTFSRSISGNGKVAQVGSGTTTLSANNTYTGATTIGAGVLNITGSNTSPMTVNTGATLTGTGSTTGSVTVNSGGTLTPTAPSGSTTILTVGATTLATGSTLNSSLGATDSAPKSLLAVQGNLTLGGTLNVTANTAALSGRYTVATYTGTLSGSFDTVSLPPGYSAKVDTSTAGLVQLVPNTVLTKQFAAGPLPVGGTVGLTFTLVNPTGGGASSGMGFTDTMSAGLLVGSGTITNTCGATVTATPGSNTVTVSGATIPAAAGNSASTCSIVVPITTSATPVLGVCAAANTTGQANTSAVSGIDTSVSMASTCVPVSAGLVSGVVFNDGGVGGGAANDGIRNGAEAGIAGVAVALTSCAGTTYASTTTDGSGAYSLAPPATLAVNSGVCVAISPSVGPVATGASVSGTATPNGSATNVVGVNYIYTRAANQQSFNLPLSGVAGLNFGLVPASTFGNNSQLSGSAGNTVRHKHQFVAGSAGTVTFSVSNSVASPGVSGWSEKLFRNASCDGVLSGSDVASPLTSVAVTQGQVVCVVLEEFVPAGASGSRTVTLQAAFALTNANPALGANYTVQDITLAGSSAIVISKQVRNVTMGGSFGLNNQAKPSDVLEYQLSYANNSDKQVTNVVVNDTTPAYTTFVSATEGTTPAGLSNCRKNTPANPLPGGGAVSCGTVQSTGGAGPIRWVFDGALLPGATGTVFYQVQVAP